MIYILEENFIAEIYKNVRKEDEKYHIVSLPYQFLQHHHPSPNISKTICEINKNSFYEFEEMIFLDRLVNKFLFYFFFFNS